VENNWILRSKLAIGSFAIPVWYFAFRFLLKPPPLFSSRLLLASNLLWVDGSDLPLSPCSLALCKLLDKRLFELQSERLRPYSCLCMDSFTGHPYCRLLKAVVRKKQLWSFSYTTALQATSNLWCQQWAECPPMILLFESHRNTTWRDVQLIKKKEWQVEDYWKHLIINHFRC